MPSVNVIKLRDAAPGPAYSLSHSTPPVKSATTKTFHVANTAWSFGNPLDLSHIKKKTKLC